MKEVPPATSSRPMSLPHNEKGRTPLGPPSVVDYIYIYSCGPWGQDRDKYLLLICVQPSFALHSLPAFLTFTLRITSQLKPKGNTQKSLDT